MRSKSRIERWGAPAIAFGLVAASLLGCGKDTPTGNGGGGGPVDLGPFRMFEVSLQPNVVERPRAGATTPNPLVVQHALSVFSRGGSVVGVFDWTVPAAVGRVVPKTAQLSVRDNTVALHLRDDGMLPLGFFDVRVRGQSGSERDSAAARFAVVQNSWMKHKRQVSAMFTPELTRTPVVYSPPGTPPDQDVVYYTEAPSATTTKLRRIRAYTRLNGPEQEPGDVILLPSVPPANNFTEAAKTSPDVAPFGLGRSELLFASTMDINYGVRCPGGECPSGVRPPSNLWVVQHGTIVFTPRVLTFDSTRVVPGGQRVFYAFNYTSPRWDPAATGSTARIAFLSNRSGSQELWLGDLVDRDGNGSSDELVEHRRLTSTGISRFDWHPDGTRLCVVSANGLGWVDASSGAFAPIELPDSSLTRFGGVSVYAAPGEHTLVAVQAARENLSNLYVYDEVDRTLTRLLPTPFGIEQPMHPRWHPRRKEIFYVSDYTVEAWSNSSGGSGSPPDLYNPTTEFLYGQRRTRFPSVWSVRLQEP